MDFYELSCTNAITKVSLCDKDFVESFKGTWYLWKHGGYIRIWYKGRHRFLHDLIMRRMEDKPSDKYSVDHINQDKLDNRRENLRWATQSQQNRNRGKKNRSKIARPLPEGLTQDMMPKYVNYNKECYNKEKNLWREFFRIEKHPKLTKKCISSSKSSKLTILEKLDDIKEKLNNLNNLINNT
tara:strand:+ start:595 stop:1143 length:549 start_codon:yes stop_codon:yes gene_type:complete